MKPAFVPALAKPTESYKYKHFPCHDTGILLASLKDGSPGDYAFKCWCDAGKFKKSRYPSWLNFPGKALFHIVELAEGA